MADKRARLKGFICIRARKQTFIPDGARTPPPCGKRKVSSFVTESAFRSEANVAKRGFVSAIACICVTWHLQVSSQTGAQRKATKGKRNQMKIKIGIRQTGLQLRFEEIHHVKADYPVAGSRIDVPSYFSMAI
ncbi:hypothetical protein ZHAS_00015464 [Anopheles sinensis]|uniref:Uncharacterized protein n=1 Tax=Anopheles sinensis TaxID=74873 RepID=A0A084WBB4_ANOSI|nr:hypothetical protein ZHAS_00015464 [Anopheles sinensis]